MQNDITFEEFELAFTLLGITVKRIGKVLAVDLGENWVHVHNDKLAYVISHNSVDGTRRRRVASLRAALSIIKRNIRNGFYEAENTYVPKTWRSEISDFKSLTQLRKEWETNFARAKDYQNKLNSIRNPV